MKAVEQTASAELLAGFEDVREEEWREAVWEETSQYVRDVIIPALTTEVLDTIQLVLDVVGIFIEPADGLNAVISLARGNKIEAAICVAAMVPMAGSVVAVPAKYAARTSARVARLAVHVSDDVLGAVVRNVPDFANSTVRWADHMLIRNVDPLADDVIEMVAEGGACFVAGTHVVMAGLPLPPAAEPESAGWDWLWTTALAGMALAVVVAPERRKRPAEQEDALPTDADRDELPLPPDELDKLCEMLVTGEAFDAESQTAASDEVWGSIGSEPVCTVLDRPAVKRTMGRARPTQTAVARKKPKVTSPPETPKYAPTRRSRWRWVAALVCMLAAGFFGLRASGFVGGTAPSSKPALCVEYGKPWLQNVEHVKLCQRTVGVNPELSDVERTWTEPNPATWKRLRLLAPKVDGRFAKVRMVRGPDWLDQQQAEVGGTVEINVPECGIEGRAEVLAIDPRPPVQPGEGPVITAIFEHEVAEVIDVHVEGLEDPIGCTPNHPFWSADRQEFVRADELREGERLDLLKGTAQVTAIVLRGEPEAVYNLEVQGEHVYRVTAGGVLVHNAMPCAAQFAVGPHGQMLTPRLGTESHHGVLSAWMKARFANYSEDLAPAILMLAENHVATKGITRTWMAKMAKKHGGTLDWSKVTDDEIIDLAEDMFDAAEVPQSFRDEYWKMLNEYASGLK